MSSVTGAASLLAQYASSDDEEADDASADAAIPPTSPASAAHGSGASSVGAASPTLSVDAPKTRKRQRQPEAATSDQDNDEASLRLKRRLLEKMLVGEATDASPLPGIRVFIHLIFHGSGNMATHLGKKRHKRMATETNSVQTNRSPGQSSSSANVTPYEDPCENVRNQGGETSRAPESRPSPVIWKAVVDKSSGDTYYYDPKTKETSWEVPENSLVDLGDGVIRTADGKPAVSSPIESPVARPQHANSMFSLKNGPAAGAPYTGRTNGVEYTAKAKIGASLILEMQDNGEALAEGNLSGMGQNNSSMKVVDQHSNIMSTAEVHESRAAAQNR